MYVPNNAVIYSNAYCGAMTGMGVSDRVPTDTDPASYAGLRTVALAFAQCLDSLVPPIGGPLSIVVSTFVANLCAAAWQDRAPQLSPVTTDPASYTALCKALLAISDAFGTGLGPIPGLQTYGEVLCTSADQSASFLFSKLVAGPGISLSLLSPGGNEQIEISAPGGPGPSSPTRVDCSVNAAYTESPYGATPVLHTRSSGSVAGGYNGGGVGNKAILGFLVGDLMPLAALVSLEWTWLDLNSPTPGLAVFANLVLDVNGDGSAYKIAVSDPASLPVLNNCATVVNGDGSRTSTFLAATMNLLIVNGLPVPPLPPGGPGFVPPTVPGAPLPAGWTSNGYSVASVLAAYPACRLAVASSGDGGLPKAPNKTPAFMLITGDSTNQLIRAFRISDMKFNGVPC